VIPVYTKRRFWGGISPRLARSSNELLGSGRWHFRPGGERQATDGTAAGGWQCFRVGRSHAPYISPSRTMARPQSGLGRPPPNGSFLVDVEHGTCRSVVGRRTAISPTIFLGLEARPPTICCQTRYRRLLSLRAERLQQMLFGFTGPTPWSEAVSTRESLEPLIDACHSTADNFTRSWC